jgi:hypothetical protein
MKTALAIVRALALVLALLITAGWLYERAGDVQSVSKVGSPDSSSFDRAFRSNFLANCKASARKSANDEQAVSFCSCYASELYGNQVDGKG